MIRLSLRSTVAGTAGSFFAASLPISRRYAARACTISVMRIAMVPVSSSAGYAGLASLGSIFFVATRVSVVDGQ